MQGQSKRKQKFYSFYNFGLTGSANPMELLSMAWGKSDRTILAKTSGGAIAFISKIVNRNPGDSNNSVKHVMTSQDPS